MPLITEYRPESWGQVLRPDAQVKSFAHAIATRSAQTYLLSGPSGVGKTTLARIAARELGCAEANRIDYDAAYLTGVKTCAASTPTCCTSRSAPTQRGRWSWTSAIC